ncbi:hypothetical protein Isop_3316 [Isosphaera pallida ATCC 43644]|uniref:Tetratricopeptide repeat protein n=2 Tax=Isosphaera pallida TaxID=128 RepID=E8R5X6_ISOPI|nr:hypothetical protein Isop_3316 [Isosphaera pallida ATCC 43644]
MLIPQTNRASRIRTRCWTLAWLMAATVGPSTLMCQTWADEVRLIPGSTFKSPAVVSGRIRGTITEETPETITLKVGGQTVAVPVDQVDRVTYDQAPASLTAAASLARGNNPTRAAEEFQKAANEARNQPLVRQAALFGYHNLNARMALGDPNAAPEAIRNLEGFLKEFPKARQRGEALITLIRLQIAIDDFDAARRNVQELGAIAWATDLAKVFNARIAAESNDAAAQTAALSDLDSVIASSTTNPVVKRDAQLAKAQVLAAARKFEEARRTVEEVIAGADPEDAATLAAAHNTLGDCLIAENRPKDALMNFLHVDILYSSEREQHARALAAIVALWNTLGKPERAREVLGKLKSEYPQSPYTAQAERG